MHAYLKTIGFSKIKTTKELQEILRDVVENYDRKKIVETEEHHLFAEFSKEYAYDCGITVCGEIDENNRFQMEYYYPYFEGGQISSYEEVSVERHVCRRLRRYAAWHHDDLLSDACSGIS